MPKTILALSDHRSDETITPLERVSEEAYCVDVSNFDSIFNRMYFIFSQCLPILYRKEVDAILLAGNGFTAIFAYLFSILFSHPLIYRLGGDPYQVEKGKLNDKRGESIVEYFTYLVFYKVTIYILENSTGIIVVSNNLKRDLEKKVPVNDSQIRVAHVPIDESLLELNQGVSNKGVSVLTVTNLDFEEKFKGTKRSLDIMESVLDRNPEMEYRVAGGGKYFPSLKKYADVEYQSDVRDRIKLLGYVDNIGKEYYSSDIFLYLSYLDGYPNVILEAMVCHLPVVTNGDFGMKEQVVSETTGYLVDITNVREVEESLIELIDDPHKREKMGKEGYFKACTENSHKQVGEQLIMAVNEIVQEN